MVKSLFRRNRSSGQHRADDGVVLGQLPQPCSPQQVRPRITDVGNRGPVAFDQRNDRGGAHAVAITPTLSLLEDGLAGGLHRPLEDCLGRRATARPDPIDYDLARSLGRYVPGGVPAHTIEDREQSELGLDTENILVLAPQVASVGGSFGSDLEVAHARVGASGSLSSTT
jgi:hypothetical protein